jgi:hypothetical protein
MRERRYGKADCERGRQNNRGYQGFGRGVVKVGLQHASQCYVGEESMGDGEEQAAMNDEYHPPTWLHRASATNRRQPFQSTAILLPLANKGTE